MFELVLNLYKTFIQNSLIDKEEHQMKFQVHNFTKDG